MEFKTELIAYLNDNVLDKNETSKTLSTESLATTIETVLKNGNKTGAVLEDIRKAVKNVFMDKTELNEEEIRKALEKDNEILKYIQTLSASDDKNDNLQTIIGADIEDDDEDEDVEESKTSTSTTAPVLRGHLKIKENQLTWFGKWAMSAEKFNEGDKAKFKYVYNGTKEISKMTDSEGLVVPPSSGKFDGFFILKEPTAKNGLIKVKELGVTLKFTKNASGGFDVNGKGSNKFGMFGMNGKFEPKSGRFAVIKAYIADDSDDDDDIDDEDMGDAAEELAALKADNELSVEELRAKYGNPQTKKMKTG